MKNWAYRFDFIFCDLYKNKGTILRNWMTWIGTGYTFAELITKLKIIDAVDYFCQNAWLILIDILIVVLVKSINWKMKRTYRINNYDVKISIILGDILEEKDAIVISTNSSFITTMEKGIISAKSVQGAFQEKYYKNNLDLLNKTISRELSDDLSRENKVCVNGISHNCYEIGTTIKIIQNNRNVYFVALNDVNENGQNANRKEDDFYAALNGLWDYVASKGNTEDILSLPIIATGRAGIATLTKERAIQDIVESFISSMNNSNAILTRHLQIIIYYNDIKDIDINEIDRFITQRCYFTKKYNGPKSGNSV